MPICPKCGKEIDYLRSFCKQSAEYTLQLRNGEPDYEHLSSADFYEDEEFACPECDEILFTDEEEAIEFLKEN